MTMHDEFEAWFKPRRTRPLGKPTYQMEIWQAAYRAGLEQAAQICDRFAERKMHPAECAAAIRAMKDAA